MKSLLAPIDLKLSLRQNFAWVFAGNLIYAGCQWGILVILVKLTNPEMVGQFALGLAVTAPIIMFSQLQLRGVQATDARSEYEFGHYFALRLITTGAAMIVIAIVTLLGKYDWSTALVILVVGLSKAIESISDVFYGLMQRYERMDRIALSLIIKGGLSLAVTGILVFFSRNVLVGVLGLAATWGTIMLTYDLYNVKVTLKDFGVSRTSSTTWLSLTPLFDMHSLLKLTWLALPLGFVMALISVNTNFPRYFIAGFLGEAELGIFAALAYLVIAGNTLVSAIGQSAVPRMARYYSRGAIEKFRVLLMRQVKIGIFIGASGILVALFIGKPLLSILYSLEYAENVLVFVYLMFAAALSYLASIMGYGMTAVRYFRVQLPIVATVTLITVIASFLFIPRFGMAGGAMSLALGAIVQIVGGGLVIVHALHRNYKETD